VAIGAFKSISEAMFKIPEDIAIVGYDNIDLCSYFDPQLTSVNANGFNLGITATDMLVKLIRDRNISEIKMLLKPELIIRQS